MAVVLTHPIQYFSPLFDALQIREDVDLLVAYGCDAGLKPASDEGFGQVVAWDLDLVGGHRHIILNAGGQIGKISGVAEVRRLTQVVRGADVVVIHGYSTPLVAWAILLCRLTRTPYLLRSDTSVLQPHYRLDPRVIWRRFATHGAAGAMVIGERNAAVHRSNGARRTFPMPMGVDSPRFREAARITDDVRATRRRVLGLAPEATVVAFSGKLVPHKHPRDVANALLALDESFEGMFIGSGRLLEELEQHPARTRFAFLGFVNQAEMPATLALADVLVLPSETEPWGMVIEEALACGLGVVASDAVGAVPDLVSPFGASYPVGDVEALARAIIEAARRRAVPGWDEEVAELLAGRTPQECARLLTEAAQAVAGCRNTRT